MKLGAVMFKEHKHFVHRKDKFFMLAYQYYYGRGKRTSLEQMTIIVDFLEENRVLVTGKCHPMHQTEYDEKCDQLIKILNDSNGAKIDKKQWRTFLSEWKSKIRKKARCLKESIMATGGGDQYVPELTQLENRLLKVLGWVSVTGSDNLPPEIDPDLMDHEILGVETEISTGVLLEDNYIFVDEAPCTSKIELAETNTSQKTGGIKRSFSRDNIKRGKKNYKKTQLEKSAELYSSSTENMTGAVHAMAKSISELATSFSDLAVAISSKKDL